MGVRWVWLAIALSVKLQLCRSQCEGEKKSLANGNGSIQSPNYGYEYGKAESCTWRTLNYPNSVTILRLTSFKIVPPTGGCDDSYMLTIGGEKVDCKMYIQKDDRSKSKCYAFPYKCKSIPDVGKCTIRNETERVKVRYVANGKTANSKYQDSYMHGFEMKYETYGCQDSSEKGRTTSRPNRERTNTNRNVHNRNRVSASSVSTTTRRKIKNRNTPRRATTTAVPAAGSRIQSRRRDAMLPPALDPTTGPTSPPPIFMEPTTNTLLTEVAKEDEQSSTIVVIIILLVATILIGIGIVFFIKKRKKQESRGVPSRPQTQEENVDNVLYGGVNEVTATYAEIDLSTRNNGTTTSQSNHLRATTSRTFNQSYGDQPATPTQQHPIEEQSSSVYSQIDRSSKRRGRAEESESQSRRDVYSAVFRDNRGTKVSVHIENNA